MAELRFSNGDAISAAVLAALGCYIVIEAREWPYLAPEGPGPGFFPIWYGIALIALSLVVVGARVYRITRGDGRQRRLTSLEKREIAHALTVWAAFAASIGLLKILGFMIAFALLTWFIVAVIYRRPWTTATAVAFGTALGFYLVFPLGLSVTLPVGVLGF